MSDELQNKATGPTGRVSQMIELRKLYPNVSISEVRTITGQFESWSDMCREAEAMHNERIPVDVVQVPNTNPTVDDRERRSDLKCSRCPPNKKDNKKNPRKRNNGKKPKAKTKRKSNVKISKVRKK